MNLTYGSGCSGIEAATVAWEPLGWRATWFAQFDPDHNYARGPDFPSAVLAHHYPDVPNLGDMTRLVDLVELGVIDAPDVFVAGTPCQDFSVAGRRAGLAGNRGQLTLAYLDLCDALDAARERDGLPPTIHVWENVPGVLSDKNNAFGCLLAGLAGETVPLEPPGRRWTDAGLVLGPERVVAWRILDAQFFRLAQRRRRVFVVASAREGFDPAGVLLEFEGLRRDSPPRRSEEKDLAGTLEARASDGGFPGSDGTVGYHVVPARRPSGLIAPDVSPTLRAGGNRTGGDRPPGTDVDTADSLIVQAVALRGRDGGSIAELGGEQANALRASEGGGSHPYVLAPLPFDTTQVTSPYNYSSPKPGDPCHPLAATAHPPAISHQMAVRRLMPEECEALQGFQPGYTAIPYRAKLAADGPRYKSIGNSKATFVVRWLGRRIERNLAIQPVLDELVA